MNFTSPTKVVFSNELVLTTKQIAEFYGCKPYNIRQNFNLHKDHFIEGKHYFKVEGDDLQNLRVESIDAQISPKIRIVYLWTKRGAALHAKMLTTDRAWEVYEMLEDFYFKAEETYLNAQKKSELNQNSQAKNFSQPQTSIQTQAAVPKPQIKLYEILEDIQQSAELLAEMTESDYKVAVAISKEAAEKYYGVDLSAFDILISVNCSEKIICTPVDD